LYNYNGVDLAVGQSQNFNLTQLAGLRFGGDRNGFGIAHFQFNIEP
jgi:hypothetical protein